MAINFPSSPTSGDTYVYGDFTYAYDGEKWTSQGTVDEEYVKKTGDQMSGDLIISQGTGGIQLKSSATDQTDLTYTRADGTASHTLRHIEGLNLTQFIARDAAEVGTDYIAYYHVEGDTHIKQPHSKSPQGGNVNSLTRKDYVDASIPTRKKSEVHWTGLNLTLTAGVATNIITLLNSVASASGSWAPMFNNTTGKLTPFNDDRTVNFKLNLMGSFAGGSTNRALQLDFTGTVGNRIVVMRDSNISPSPNSIQFATFFSVDKDGNMALNGTTPMVTALGGDFTISEALIIAEQVTTEG